jgi:hypothetical protein
MMKWLSLKNAQYAFVHSMKIYVFLGYYNVIVITLISATLSFLSMYQTYQKCFLIIMLGRAHLEIRKDVS